MPTRSFKRSSARPQDDRGVTLVLMALLMVALLTIVAIVVDIALIRSDRRSNQSIADFAVTAGVRELGGGPWAGVCMAFDYLAGQDAAFASLNPPTYTDGTGTVVADPCAAPASHPPCVFGNQSTWAVLTATSSDGLIRVTIESPYSPATDTDFATPEAAHSGDAGVPCDQLAVRVFETKEPTFSRVIGAGNITSSVRSAARRTLGPGQEPAALILLERHDCNTLQTSGTNTRVIAQAKDNKPGIMQVDSDAKGDCNSQYILNGQAGPTILACSTQSTALGCQNLTATLARDSVVGVYAALVNPTGNIAPPFSANTYGDTAVKPVEQFTRGPVDDRYGNAVLALDDRLTTLLAGAAPKPPTCGAVDPTGHCTTTPGAEVWRVLSGGDCSPAAAATAAGTDTNVWFDCGGFNVNAPLSLPVAQKVVFNGDLRIVDLLHIPNAHEVFIQGKTTGNNIGLDVGNGGVLALNDNSAASCAAAKPSRFQNVLAVLHGSYDVGSGGAIRTCDTFTFLASSGGKVPEVGSTGVIQSGTAPCPSVDNATACDGYRGSIRVSSGSSVDWSAYDSQNIPFCNPLVPTIVPPNCYIATTPGLEFEDLGLWGESATDNGINGNGGLTLEGVFFLPNAQPFSISGGSAQVIQLGAQFIVRELFVGGGAIIKLVPDPNDALTVRPPVISLIR